MSFYQVEKNKINNDEYNLMMANFKERMNQYNNFGFETTSIEDIKVNNVCLLDLNDADIMTIVDKTMYELKMYKTNVNNINKQTENYEEILNDMNNFRKMLKSLEEKYIGLMHKTTLIHSEHKLPFIKHFGLDEETGKKFDLFVLEIENSLEKQRDLLTMNLNKINRIKKFIRNGMSQEKEQMKNICSICVTNKVDICINPCGHTFCQSCTNKMNRCSMCRGQITTKIKLFLDDQDDDTFGDAVNSVNTVTGDTTGTVSGFTGFISNFTVGMVDNIPATTPNNTALSIYPYPV